VIVAGVMAWAQAVALAQELPLPTDGGAPAPEAATPAPEAAPITGTLDLLSSPPGVSVDIDGVSEGVTPLVGVVLTPGTHRLRLWGPGLKPQERTIDIVAGQNLQVSMSVPPMPPPSQSFLGSGPEVPLATAILAGTSAVLFGVGLGFGVAANNIQHQAGVDVSNSGVDLGITRAEAIQGKHYANTANVLYVGAAAALVSAVIVAIVTPRHATEPSPVSGPSGAGQETPAPLGEAAWSFR
jgi:hypothetical protein